MKSRSAGGFPCFMWNSLYNFTFLLKYKTRCLKHFKLKFYVFQWFYDSLNKTKIIIFHEWFPHCIYESSYQIFSYKWVQSLSDMNVTFTIWLIYYFRTKLCHVISSNDVNIQFYVDLDINIKLSQGRFKAWFT